MKSFVAIALGLASVKSQGMTPNDSLFRQFGNCMGSPFGSTQGCEDINRPNAQCCDFEVVNEESITGKFCITNSQRDGEWSGTYRDYDYTLWRWQCKEPSAPSGPSNNNGGQSRNNDLESCVIPPWNNYEDKLMEWLLWVTYLSGEAWILGWIVMLPLGLAVYGWLALLSMWQFIEIFLGVGDFGQWFMGPFLRAWVTGPFIYFSAVLLTIIPGVNFVSSFFLGWWANLDYYNYDYELFEGPNPPAGCGKRKGGPNGGGDGQRGQGGQGGQDGNGGGPRNGGGGGGGNRPNRQ